MPVTSCGLSCKGAKEAHRGHAGKYSDPVSHAEATLTQEGEMYECETDGIQGC